jgi:hypothetical protein
MRETLDSRLPHAHDDAQESIGSTELAGTCPTLTSAWPLVESGLINLISDRWARASQPFSDSAALRSA